MGKREHYTNIYCSVNTLPLNEMPFHFYSINLRYFLFVCLFRFFLRYPIITSVCSTGAHDLYWFFLFVFF